jgi:hypothetical protein
MPVINIQSLAKPTTLVTANDSANPYSFQQWKQYNNNIDARAQIDQYNTYLKNWYKARANTPQAMFQYVRKTYTDFLKQLGLSTRNPEEQTFFSIINYSDDLDIQGAVTYFARKLKDVSRYIAERRSNIVYSKLKYNQLGTNGYLENLFYSYILSVFTQRPDSGNAGLVVSNGNLLQYLPNLNDISDSFSIEIEELYDIANYHDRDPSVSINWYTTFAADTYPVLYNTSLYEAPTQYLLGLIIQALNTANTLNPCYGVTGFVGTSVSNNMANSSNVYIYAGDGYTTTYALNNITQTDGGMYRVTIDGLFQTPYNAYKISVQNSNLVFSEAPPAGAEIVIITPS